MVNTAHIPRFNGEGNAQGPGGQGRAGDPVIRNVNQTKAISTIAKISIADGKPCFHLKNVHLNGKI
jgi:hypothetical protein